MNSDTLPNFWTCYYQLDPATRQTARNAYQKWAENPRHPSLQFKRIGSSDSLYSIRVGAHYRALGREIQEGTITWFWIGTHEEYNNLLSRLRQG